LAFPFAKLRGNDCNRDADQGVSWPLPPQKDRPAQTRVNRETSMHRNFTMLATGALLMLGSALPAYALDKVNMGTNWLAEAEHGGYYQAVADGTYAKYGLDVTIVQGGPQSPNEALLISGKVDFYMGSMLSLYDDVKQGIPMVNVAAIFQKDPQVIIAHPEVKTFADLAKLDTIYMGNEGFATYFMWMKANFPGFKDEQYKPYTFNSAPFIADAKSAEQGYLTSEPLAVKQSAGWEPSVFLLADEGYSPYSTTIETTTKLVQDNPDLVQRFVDATIIGWYNYLYGDNKAANDLIKKDDPEMTDEQIAYSIGKMKDYGIVVSGEATTKGIGCMTDARQKDFYDLMVKLKIVDASVDYTKSYTTQFVCKGLGVEMAK
jgi:NitT/TauT family transport system substrate-binding protein